MNRPVLRVEEQWDIMGDLVYSLTLLATTYDRRMIDRIAEVAGVDMHFVTENRVDEVLDRGKRRPRKGDGIDPSEKGSKLRQGGNGRVGKPEGTKVLP